MTDKQEWRMVPVEPTDEMMQAMDESSPATYWKRCPWKAALDAAPAPQAKPCERCAEFAQQAEQLAAAQKTLSSVDTFINSPISVESCKQMQDAIAAQKEGK